MLSYLTRHDTTTHNTGVGFTMPSSCQLPYNTQRVETYNLFELARYIFSPFLILRFLYKDSHLGLQSDKKSTFGHCLNNSPTNYRKEPNEE